MYKFFHIFFIILKVLFYASICVGDNILAVIALASVLPQQDTEVYGLLEEWNIKKNQKGYFFNYLSSLSFIQNLLMFITDISMAAH